MSVPTTPSKPTTPSRPRTHTNSVITTPKRPASALSFASSTSTSSLSSSVSTLLGSTHKRYKAPLSVEPRPRPKSQAVILSPIQSSPSHPGSRASSRPRTPGTPSRKPDLFDPVYSENDVSVIDPEEKTIDYSSIEPEADASFELEEDLAWVKDHGKENKVQVSIRIRPSDGPSALSLSPSTNSLSVTSSSNLSASTSSTPFTFDAILTGSPNRPIYNAVARSHVRAAMDGYNAVIFAYGQTASGKTYTLSGAPPATDLPGDRSGEPGIIPRAMKDVFAHIRATASREYLLRCSYLEIYNETVYDLLAPPATSTKQPVQIHGGQGGSEVVLSPLREEVVTSLKGVREVLGRGERNRRTACTDWNERSSRSHSVFRMVIESRERGSAGGDEEAEQVANGRCTPATPGGRKTPGLGGGPRLQAKGGKGVTTSVLSLIDLAGSEKATSDKERTREGKYINTSLLTLGTVIGTLADNVAKKKSDHVPYRNSKLTRLLQPSLAGNARISVVCTLNPDPSALAETMSTLGFAKRIKGVSLNAQKKEVIDTDALIERYRKEIEELKTRLAEKEKEAPVFKRRLSAREQVDESKAMTDLNARIQQLTKLILTSQTVELRGDDSRPASPVKVDFNMTPYQLQQELLSARLQLESQATQILSLEAALESRPPLSPDSGDDEKDKFVADQKRGIEELEVVISASNDDGMREEMERKIRMQVEKEWAAKMVEEERKRVEKERWAEEVIRELEKEKSQRQALEGERRALQAFVKMFDSLGLGGPGITSSFAVSPSPRRLSRVQPPRPSPGGAAAAFTERKSQTASAPSSQTLPALQEGPATPRTSLSDPYALTQVTINVTGNQIGLEGQQELMSEIVPEDVDGWNNDTSFGLDEGEEQDEVADMLMSDSVTSLSSGEGTVVLTPVKGLKGVHSNLKTPGSGRTVLGDLKEKENINPLAI